MRDGTRFKFARSVLSAFLCLIVGACASATRYRSADDGGPGYREVRLANNRFRVAYLGNARTSKETVEIYLLYRAAELTLENGFDSFRLTSYATEAKTDFDVMGPPMYGYYATTYSRFPYYAYGYPWSYSTAVDVVARTRYEAVSYVQMFKKSEAPSAPDLYVAQEVRAALEPKIQRP